tara:strand:- start:73 stop:249 length:177 start_codon:yes stop_codon:yes gene_type:complete
MRKVIDYEVLTHYKILDFNHDINVKLNKGFELLGVPFCGRDVDNDVIFCQAMVKYEDS